MSIFESRLFFYEKLFFCNMDSPEIQAAQYKRWLNLIRHVNPLTANLSLVHAYFDGHFGKDPKKISEFLMVLKVYLQRCKNIDMRKEIAYKYFEVISHLCEKYSVARKGQAMDNYCYRILNPVEYYAISEMLHKYKKNANKYVDLVIEAIKSKLDGKGFDYELVGRYKNIYSIHKKIQRYPHKNIFQIRDIFAFRIVLHNDSIGDCYKVLSVLRRNFEENREFFKDYINYPKDSGYQSIHLILTNIIDNLDLPIEVQIRTKSMDNFAKHGLCAHWLYSGERSSSFVSNCEKKVIRNEILDNNNQRKPKNGNYMMVLDKYGDVVILKGSHTILDYAYKTSKEAGHRIKYALVNNRKKHFDYTLRTGDKVELIFSKRLTVRQKWSNLVYMKSSKTLIENYIKCH